MASEVFKTESLAVSDAIPTPAVPLHVLLIEDNPGDAELIQFMVAKTGETAFQFHHAETLTAGLAYLSKSPMSLVLLDLSLPDSQGLETFQKLHETVPSVPVVVMSGLNDETVAVHAVQMGAQDYFVKGEVDGPLLVRAIRYAMERKRIQDELERVAAKLREENHRMEKDLSMAREVQQVFLPHQYPTIPNSAPPGQSAIRFHHRYQPAAVVSGDFFTVVQISESAVGVFVCDVMGHGLRGALVTAIMRGLIEELKPAAGDPGRFLTEINRSLVTILKRTNEPLMATALFLVLDPATGTAKFANAGHPRPLHMKADRSTVLSLDPTESSHGPALGLFDDSRYATSASTIARGDRFLLYTDGIYEAEGARREEFGQQRLLAAFRQHAQLQSPELLDALIAKVQAFSIDSEFRDDVCLIAIEVDRLLNES